MEDILQEKRKCHRYQLPVNVDAVIGDRLIKSTARDISCAGLFLTTRSNLQVDSEACVVVSLPGRHLPIKLKGKSVRVELDGVAVQFHGISPYFVENLSEELERAAVHLQFGGSLPLPRTENLVFRP
ncbi:PilZ domain-containing protein [uncultured Desulfobacter sp.]|uniref:PilZ domain-containing protein n=1 Tax=uncultured Desulfobacter sp. TaxID=240139 RepID=UPI002AABA690|nr:PilZ domain-containing protein [uncultured Desulfobacter sp.]